MKSTVYAEAVLAASRQGMTVQAGTSTADVLQEVLDRAVGGMRYAASEVDKLSPDELWVKYHDDDGNVTNVRMHKWYRLEVECRQEVMKLAGMMQSLGIAERAVRVEEAKAALMVAAVRDAAREAGLSAGQVRALGSALRNRLESMSEAVAA